MEKVGSSAREPPFVDGHFVARRRRWRCNVCGSRGVHSERISLELFFAGFGVVKLASRRVLGRGASLRRSHFGVHHCGKKVRTSRLVIETMEKQKYKAHVQKDLFRSFVIGDHAA